MQNKLVVNKGVKRKLEEGDVKGKKENSKKTHLRWVQDYKRMWKEQKTQWWWTILQFQHEVAQSPTYGSNKKKGFSGGHPSLVCDFLLFLHFLLVFVFLVEFKDINHQVIQFIVKIKCGVTKCWLVIFIWNFKGNIEFSMKNFENTLWSMSHFMFIWNVMIFLSSDITHDVIPKAHDVSFADTGPQFN